MPTEDGAPPAPSAAVQDELAGLRDQLLSGRGPGAGVLEVLQHTRSRTRLGGKPVPQVRQEVAVQAGAARRDVEVMARKVAEDRAQLVWTLRDAARIGRSTVAPRWWRGLRRVGRITALVAALVCFLGLSRRLPRRRP